MSENDETNLSLLKVNIDSVLVPANSYNDIEIIKNCLNLLFDSFEKEGEVFQYSPVEYKTRVMFYKEHDPQTFHRIDEFWTLYKTIKESCMEAVKAIHRIELENSNQQLK